MTSSRRWRLALAALALVVAAPACGGDDGKETGTSDPAVREADEGIAGVLAIRIGSTDHTEARVDYDRHPPAGGDHNPVPAPCGFYDEAIPDEYVVHSLEHGAVWLAYAPALDAADLATLRDVVAEESDTIATPYADLDAGTAVVVTSWARQLTLDSVDDPRLVEFIEQYRKGDQAPEASIGCPQKTG